MSQSSSQAKTVMAMCKARYPLPEIVQRFFQLNDWTDEHELQLDIQNQIIHANAVDAAIDILLNSEFKCNIAFDFDEIMDMVVQNATASQAFNALRKVHLAPAHTLQSIILSKGSHDQIIELKNWQLSPNKLEPKRLL